MGAKKKESIYAWSTNRNLGKTQLGSVIFGVTNLTINECLSKQLFGLPKEHLEYVEKVGPGLPLFLFNYTDKKLHGVFEAASRGKKDIDPYAWTSEGKQKTPFAAQVQVRVRSPRQPLTEDQFKPAIMDNYYNRTHFWFELDHAQTNRLLSLFSSQPVVASLFTTNFQFVPKRVESGPKEKKASAGFSGKNVLHSDTIRKEDEMGNVNMKLKGPALNRKFFDPFTGGPFAAASEDDTTVRANTSSMEDSVIAQLAQKVEYLMAFTAEQANRIECLEQNIIFLNQHLTDAQNENWHLKDRCMMLESKAGPSEANHGPHNINSDDSPDVGLDKLSNECPSDDSHFINLDSCDDLIYLVGGYDGTSWFSSLDAYSPSNNNIKSLKPMNVAQCYTPVSVLNGELYVFGGSTGGEWFDTVESYNPVVNEWTSRPALNAKKGSLAGATLDDKIYAIGGGKDTEFYSAVEMLDLDIGAWVPSRSMLEKRFSLAAAELNGAIYAVGGYDGKNYLKSAERYDPREHSWTRIESMNTVRGCPCLVILNEKLWF
ncbi:uncharacterized protein LOC143572193 isoform X2 [Bidens hawaiensis]|uniref:uncharacterized protein LOC143572193 isoform X2 n=1 Tax=Bidens hawaiensis TaxID=980011 RepID=UPI004049E856